MGRETALEESPVRTVNAYAGGPPSVQDLQHLAEFTFDVIWEAEITEDAVNVSIHALRDLSLDLGLAEGTLGSPLKLDEWFSYLHPDDRPYMLRNIAKVVETNERYFLEYRLRHRDGSDLWFEDMGYPVAFKDRRSTRWIGAVRNITEGKQREARLIKALRDAEAIKSRLEAQVRFLREEFQGGESTEPVIGNHPGVQARMQTGRTGRPD